MRFGVYYSGGLDWTFEDRPLGAMSDVIAAIPRGDYPDYAAAHLRELIARYRPSVLWNDIAWPSEGKHLWPLLTEYYAAVPDGVVNDRWMPWNPLAGAMRFGPARKVVDAGATRQARKNAGLIPPEPPFYDVRTPEYVSFPTIQRRPWECVRGMDHSFGYNAASRPDDFLARADLLWSFVDMVSKNGNLLLNVGPRGVDAQIPDEQRLRLQWLGEWLGARTGRRCGRHGRGSGPGDTTVGGRRRCATPRVTRRCSRSWSARTPVVDVARPRADADHRRDHDRDRRPTCAWTATDGGLRVRARRSPTVGDAPVVVCRLPSTSPRRPAVDPARRRDARCAAIAARPISGSTPHASA